MKRLSIPCDPLVFRGERLTSGECRVECNGAALPPRLDLFNHSPTGFEWGYAGSGPAQLALAILSRTLGQSRAADRLAISLHQEFKRDFLQGMARADAWTIPGTKVRAWIEERRA